LYLPFFFWRWSYYGFPFPNTYYAKVDAPSLALFSNGLRYTLRGIVDLIVPALAILLAVARRAGGARFGAAEKRILVVVGVVLAQIAMQGGDFLPYARFVIPIYPLFVLLAWRCARPLIETRAASRGWDMAGRRARMTAPAAAIALCFVTNFPSLNELQMLGHIAMVRTYEERARDLDEIVPEDAVIAADAIGAVKFITRLRVLDLLGLTDEVIAHTDVPTGEGLPGHEKTNVPYVLNRAPDVIFLCVRDSVRPLSACSARDFGFVPTLDRFQDSERFQHMYEYASHRVDGAFLSTYVLKANLDDAGWRRWVVVKNARELQRESLDETGGPGGGADGP
ncbi:hypothetical protein K8I61_04540, partial [bacterium]|nr:hypothetical protein [bacterium]